MPSTEDVAKFSVTVRPRAFVEDIALPFFPRMRLYDPERKPRGLARLRRKLGPAADDLVHGWLQIPARGVFTIRVADGTTASVEFDAHQSAYLAFASRAFHGGYELAETMFLEAMMAKSRVFYDVGANWGYYTLLGATHPDFKGRIYAFDISHRMNAALTSMVETLGLETVEVTGCGISDSSGYVAISADRATHLTKVVDHPDGPKARAAKALLSRLDDVSLPPPDLMKIDVEDHERAVFEGGRLVLEQHRPLILFECRCDSDSFDAGEFLVSRGYALYSLHRRAGEEDVVDLCPTGPDHAPSAGQVNLVAVARGEEARWFS